jgi:hypothetical protein
VHGGSGTVLLFTFLTIESLNYNNKYLCVHLTNVFVENITLWPLLRDVKIHEAL